jgi:hypothetical protein
MSTLVNRAVVFVIVASAMGACTHKAEKARKADSTPQEAVGSVPVLPPERCVVFKQPVKSIPHIVSDKDKSYVLTRLVKPCITRDGLRGFEKDSGWMAMGLPCTGGRGSVDITGKSYNPKVLSFVVSTDCPSAPASHNDVASLAEDELGLTKDNTLLAYNPMSIQYWEIEGYPDADVGFRIELRSDDSLRDFWNAFKDGQKKLRVKIRYCRIKFSSAKTFYYEA